MQKNIQMQWTEVVVPDVYLHDEGYYIFKFSSDEDKQLVLQQNWFLSSKPLILRNWVPNFAMDDMFERVPTWIQLRRLDLQFWGRNALDKITSKELPRKFVVKHGRNLANNVAYLTVPGGSAWKVELLKETQRAWLNQGWEAFVKFYTIELGYFLMFELVGNSVFRVIIFDTRTVEIEYPPQLAAVNQQSSRPVFKSEPVRINESNVPSVNADVKVGNTEDMKSPDDKHCEVSGCYLLESSESLEPKGEEREVEAEEEVVVKEEVEVEAEEEEDDEDEGSSSWSWRTLNDKRKPAKRQRRFYPYDKEMLMRNARASAGKIPSFIVKMRPSYVKYMYRLNVPRVFENKFLGKDKNTVKSVILQNEKRKTWLVKSMSGKFSTGWKEFVEGNQLKVDDVCVFELIKRPGFVFRVVISRASEDVWTTSVLARQTNIS